MRVGWLALVLVVAGCDSVFGLHDVEDPTDEDPRELDGGLPDAPSCSNGTMTLVPAHDTYLDSEIERGTREVLVLQPATTVIVMFPAAELAIANATLRLSRPAMARGCATGGTSCEACPAGTTGAVSVRWMRADWNEHATSIARDDNGREWAGVNASGVEDRGTTVATTTYTQGTDLEVTLPRVATDQRPEWIGGELNVALQLTTTAATAVFATREAAVDACATIAPPMLAIGCSPQ